MGGVYSGDVPVCIRWAGGKRKMLGEIGKRLPSDIAKRRYREPFLGGGAVFFAVQPEEAILSDANVDLINMYTWIRDDPEQVIDQLEVHAEQNRESRYYALRELFNSRDLEGTAAQAALFIYLNKTCFNGLWRVSKHGFNVPWGKLKAPNICEPQRLREASRALKGVELRAVDFVFACQDAGIRDFVYLDPPYIPTSPTSFTTYTKGGFGIDEHRQLAEVCRRLHARGALFLLSNSDTELSRSLYQGFRIDVVESRSNVSASAKGRGVVTELLISNY